MVVPLNRFEYERDGLLSFLTRRTIGASSAFEQNSPEAQKWISATL
jgi:hypothetical protein